jgi:hypothetical protein
MRFEGGVKGMSLYAAPVARRLKVPLAPLAILLWLALGSGLAAFTSKIADWFVMTDELLYERLALSIARTHSPLPRVHTEVVSNVNQLYPLVISPVFRHGAILHGFHQAHVLNAFVMSSAAIPAYLLARRLTPNALLPFVVAVVTVTVPWITLSSFLLTEVVAYPAFVWALLAIQAAVARPSVVRDLLAVLAVGVAVLARTQFYSLALILPVVILADALVGRRLRTAVREHVALAAVYVGGALATLALAVTGHSPLGTYTQTASGNPFPATMLQSAPAHVAVVALAGGLLPFLLGGAWAVSNLLRIDRGEGRAFAWLTVVTVIVLTVEVASFDLRFGGGLVRERYLFYIAPVLFCAFAAALSAPRLPRWSLLVPLAILALGFWHAPIIPYEKLNADTPASVLYDWLLTTMHGTGGARVALVLAALVVCLIVVEADVLLPRVAVAVALCAMLLIALPAETGYAFKRLFAVNGTSGLPLTLDQSVVFGWVDRTITTTSEAMMVPYPVIRDDYWSNIGFWWDLEFWNKSVDREAARPNQFSGTPGSFPKLDIRFDPRTGLSNVDVDSYIAQAAADVRFHLKGRFLTTQRDVSIVFPDRPWRADWVTRGLYPDGWSRPGRPGYIKVFPDAAQRGPTLRTLTLTMRAPEGASRPTTFSSNAGRWSLDVGAEAVQQAVSVCVPRTAPAEVAVRVGGASPVGGDPSTLETFAQPRQAGVLVGSIALDDQLGASCAPSR